MQMNVDEMTAHLMASQPSSGIRYARKIDADGKIVARQLILDLFNPDKWNQRLHLITMPSAHWHFERKLLGLREDGWTRYRYPSRTFFTSCENDRAVYFAAIAQMPGVYNQHGLLQKIRPYPFAEYGLKTKYGSLFFANVDDFMAFRWKDDAKWDAMWLDYIGPMTVERLQLISRFYQKHIADVLILTTLKGRWNHATSRAVKEAGSYSVWLYDNLPGELVHNIEYYDTSPMSQFAVRKSNLGQVYLDAHRSNAEIAAAGPAAHDAHSTTASGGTLSEHLGHSVVDAQIIPAETAAAGHHMSDAHANTASGGIHSNGIGHTTIDAPVGHAETAAAGQDFLDAHILNANGGTNNDLGQVLVDARRMTAETAAAGHRAVDAQGSVAGGGTPSEHLGLRSRDAHISRAETAAAGHHDVDAHAMVARGGTLSEPLGQCSVDAQRHGAETAAAGPATRDAQSRPAGGGTSSEHLGHVNDDTRGHHAETAAVGHGTIDTQIPNASGGTLSEHLGRTARDTQKPHAEIAATGHVGADTHGHHAGGGTLSTTQEKHMVNSSLKDALRRAGFDSAARELKAEAERFLQKNETPERSLVGFLTVVRKDNTLLQAMALSYLRGVAAKMPLPVAEAPENPNGVAESPAHKWPAPKPRSEADKIASRGAMRSVTIDLRQQVMINGQPIGKLSWRELRHVGRERVLKAAELIGSGQQEIIKARLIALMMEHAQVPDENATVDDVMSSDLFAKLYKQAVKEAPSITAAIIPEVARVSSQIIEHISSRPDHS